MQQSIQISKTSLEKIFHNPIFILSAPRCGSTLLFELLIQSPDFWSIGGESHKIFGQFPNLKAENEAFDSGCLTEAHADALTAKSFKTMIANLLVDREKRTCSVTDVRKPLNFLEKTPRNALNIPFILKVFPKARFIFLHREPKQNISSIIEAWETGERTGRFVTFKNLPGWHRKDWCLLLPRGWRDYNNSSYADIAVFQWQSCNEFILNHLEKLEKSRWVSLSYDKLLSDPAKQIMRLCKFANVKCDAQMKKILSNELPLSSTVVTKPNKEKWRRHESTLIPLLPAIEPTIAKLANLQR